MERRALPRQARPARRRGHLRPRASTPRRRPHQRRTPTEARALFAGQRRLRASATDGCSTDATAGRADATTNTSAATTAPSAAARSNAQAATIAVPTVEEQVEQLYRTVYISRRGAGADPRTSYATNSADRTALIEPRPNATNAPSKRSKPSKKSSCSSTTKTSSPEDVFEPSKTSSRPSAEPPNASKTPPPPS